MNKMPTSICLECLTKLNQFNEFFTTSVENQALLEIIFGEKSETNVEPEPETVEKGDKQEAMERFYIIEEVTPGTEEATHDETFEHFDSIDEGHAESQMASKEQQTFSSVFSSSNKKRKFDRFDCYLCPETFPCNLQFIQHFKSSHSSDEIRYTCFLCSNYVKKYRSYTRHLESHTDKRFSCDICEKNFSQKITLVQHLNSHSSLKTYSCDECELNFKQNSSLFKHRKQKHSNDVPTCPECHKTFVNNETLAQHMRSKHKAAKDIKCDDCLKTFASRSALIYHRASQHQKDEDNGERDCKICHKKFKTLVILSRHMKNLH